MRVGEGKAALASTICWLTGMDFRPPCDQHYWTTACSTNSSLDRRDWTVSLQQSCTKMTSRGLGWGDMGATPPSHARDHVHGLHNEGATGVVTVPLQEQVALAVSFEEALQHLASYRLGF